MREVGVSPLVTAFWEETGVKLAATCTRLCWELLPRGVFRRRERGAISHAITFLDDVAMCIPMLDAWDQFVCYCHGQAIDLSPGMLVMQFGVTDEEATYLCAARALVFEGSILAYNPTRDEVEWVPTCGITNNLSWVEERSAVALVNFMPCTPQEAARIAKFGTHHLVSWPNDSSLEEEDDDDEQAEVEGGELEEEDPTDWEEQGKANTEPLSGSVGLEQGETE